MIEQQATSEKTREPGMSEASLEGHLENERDAQPERQGPARDAPRRTASTASAAPFADDFQARLAYQTLRAVAIDRERARPAP